MTINNDLAERFAELVEGAKQHLGRVYWPATAYCEVKPDVPDHSKD